MAWIKCSERLPEKGADVLIYVPRSLWMKIRSAQFENTRWWVDSSCIILRDAATHWQPLPEPPKKEE